MHACKNNCWFSAKKTHCSPCDRKKKEEIVIEALKGNSLDALVKILKDPTYKELVQKADMLDNILRKIYILNKDYLAFHLYKIQGTSAEAHLLSRIHTHSNTYLCTIVGWMIRAGIYDTSINICCLRCMTHLMRYGESDSVKYSIQFALYGTHHVNVNSAIIKNRSNLPLLTDMGFAILESEGNSQVLTCYNQILRKTISEESYILYLQELSNHPLLHMSILQSGTESQKKLLYNKLRKRKDPFWEELIAKGMHPSRVMQWCMTEDEKQGFSEIPEYILSPDVAPWNISFC